jgi:hypothetical protein
MLGFVVIVILYGVMGSGGLFAKGLHRTIVPFGIGKCHWQPQSDIQADARLVHRRPDAVLSGQTKCSSDSAETIAGEEALRS